MQLLIIRHARAAEANAVPDMRRPLTEQGRREFAVAARCLVQRGAAPGHVFHGPALRTTETAEILAANIGLADDAREAVSWLAVGTGCREILPMLGGLPAEITAIVGHEPSMSTLASALVGGGWMAFRPGMIACIDFETTAIPGLGKLAWIIDPQML